MPRPIFPLSTLEDLREELEKTELALERTTEGPFVDLEQLDAYRGRLRWWRDRIAAQLADMEAAS